MRIPITSYAFKLLSIQSCHVPALHRLLSLSTGQLPLNSLGLGQLAVKVGEGQAPACGPLGVPGSAGILSAHPTLTIDVLTELSVPEMCLPIHAS